MEKEELLLKLFEIDAIKFGEFKLKSGSLSPIYLDLRVTVSYPAILKSVAKIMWDKVGHKNFDIICGVPYTALPIATAKSLQYDVPMVMRRKEVKDYGTKKCIEGAYNAGQTCMIIEDLVTSGSSVLETIEPLEKEGLIVKDVVVLLDREQGGKQNLLAKGYTLESVFTMSELLDILRKHNKIDELMYQKVNSYLIENQTNMPQSVPSTSDSLGLGSSGILSYSERALKCQNPTAKRLLNLMDQKKTNLSVAADVTSKAELIRLADILGPEICILKTHIDIVDDFDKDLVFELQRLSQKHNFLIFEDRKFADIGNTVKHQYSRGIYKIADWAHMVNAHAVSGPGIIDGLREDGEPRGRALILLAQMSSKGNLATGDYTQNVITMAKDNNDFVIGFISMEKITDDPSLIHFTPGVKLAAGGDTLGQQYNTPEKVIKEKGSDVIIVGRGIYQADDPVAEARMYKEAGWKAYMER